MMIRSIQLILLLAFLTACSVQDDAPPPMQDEAPSTQDEAPPPAEDDALPAQDEAPPPAEDETLPAQDEAPPPAEDEALSAQDDAPPAEDEEAPAEAEGEQEEEFSAIRYVEFFDETFPFDAENPALGFYHGNIETELGPLVGSILVELDEDGNPTITATVAKVNTPHQVATDVDVVGGHIAFTMPAMPVEQLGHLTFEGDVGEDGQWMTGIVNWPTYLEDSGTFKFQRMVRALEVKEKLAFGGEIRIADVPFKINLVFSETPGGNWVGHIDIVKHRALGWPLINVRKDGNDVVAEMGSMSPATYTGTISEDGSRFKGRYTQGPTKFDFDFERIEEYVIPVVEPLPERPQQPESQAARPQTPVSPFPYVERDVAMQHDDGHLIRGTVVIPEGDGPFPAAVLISKAGRQDRNHLVFNHRPGHVLADHLARNGIASIRYDDRGTGESTGDFNKATTADFAADALAAFNELRGYEGVDAAKVGLIGHDEGGLIAPMVAGMTEGVAFVVLMAAPGQLGRDMRIQQMELILERQGMVEEDRVRIVDAQRTVLELLAEETPEPELQAAAEGYVRAVIEGSPSAPNSSIPQTAQRFLRQQRTPWMTYFLAHDPAPSLAALRCPVLAIAGSLDMEVEAATNLQAISEAVESGGGTVTVTLYENVNHHLQPAATGAPSEYSRIPITLDPQIMADIATWIDEALK